MIKKAIIEGFKLFIIFVTIFILRIILFPFILILSFFALLGGFVGFTSYFYSTYLSYKKFKNEKSFSYIDINDSRIIKN